MTFQIRKADLPCSEEEFAERVATHVERLNEYARHLAGVEADKANPDLKPEERRVAFPGPDEHELVGRAICPDRIDGQTIMVADYEIVGPSLAERKKALTDDIRQREASLLVKVIPPAKQRHWHFREQDIHTADAARLAAHPNRVDDVEAFHRDMRELADTAFLDDLKARRESQAAIMRWAAKVEHNIDDLTEETVDVFEMPAFNG